YIRSGSPPTVSYPTSSPPSTAPTASTATSPGVSARRGISAMQRVAPGSGGFTACHHPRPGDPGSRPARAVRAAAWCSTACDQGSYHDSQGIRVSGGATMAMLTVEGVYKDGKVELSERPRQVDNPARVLVTFLPAEGPSAGPSSGWFVGRETLRQQAFAQMKEGLHLGGPPYPKRQELYDYPF